MMLAFMSQSSHPPDFHMSNSMGNNTMSLTILPPAPPSYNQLSLATETPTSSSPSKKPKLSLNTSSVAPIFGKGSTSLRLETLSATSPTVRNTFRNRQEQLRAAGKAKLRIPALTPLVTDAPTPAPLIETQTLTPSRIELPESAVSETATSPATSAASASTIESLSSEVPYKLPFNTRSILRNGPVARTQNRRFSFSQSRPIFPAAKQVAFRSQLTEDIENSRYTLRHSDIESITIEDTTQEELRNDQQGAKAMETVSSPLGKRTSRDDDDDSETCPVTPVAGRRKRDREWVWTLGPIPTPAPEEPKEGSDAVMSPTTPTEASTSDSLHIES